MQGVPTHLTLYWVIGQVLALALFPSQARAYEFQESCCNIGLEAEAEYLYMWRSKRSSPPLLTTNPTGGAPSLNNPDTKVLFGGNKLNDSPQSGVRGEVNVWYNNTFALGVGGFWIHEESKRISIASDAQGVPSIGIPFFNVRSNVEGTTFIAREDAFVGKAHGSTTNRLWEVEAALRWRVANCCSIKVDLIGGYQHYCLEDTLKLEAETSNLSIIFSETGEFNNRFSSNNRFNGGLVGVSTNFSWGCWDLVLIGKIGLGEMRSKVKIVGFSQVTPENLVLPIGFVQDSNRGTYQECCFQAISELDGKLKYRFYNCFSVSLGYMFVYFPEVYLAGEQIDRNLDPFDGSIFPMQLKKKSSFWIQGLTVGLGLDF